MNQFEKFFPHKLEIILAISVVRGDTKSIHIWVKMEGHGDCAAADQFSNKSH